MNPKYQKLFQVVEELENRMLTAKDTISTLERRLSHAGDVIRYQSIFLAVFGVFPTLFTIYTITQVNEIKTELNETIGNYLQETQNKRVDESISWVGLPEYNKMLRYRGAQILQSTQPVLSDAQTYKLLKFAARTNDRILIRRIQEIMELQPNDVSSEFFKDELLNKESFFDRKLLINYLASHEPNFILNYLPTIQETEGRFERYGFFWRQLVLQETLVTMSL